MLILDGSMGEGGGQILRTSLALSMATRTPVRIEKIRARRRKPGLMRQHLTAVKAAAAVSHARVEGVARGSGCVTFEPGEIEAGEYCFDVGTAGSATLVLQTVLPALLTAQGPSTLVLEGGTHNPFAPPFPFLDRAYLPLINRMGPEVRADLEQHGFFPAGGGRFRVEIRPCVDLTGLHILERGEIRIQRARALVARLQASIGQREIRRVEERLSWDRSCLEVEEVHSDGPGNVLLLEVQSEHVTEVFTGFGKRGVPAERVADGAVNEARRYLASGVPVGVHLADQLLLPLALAGGGSIRTLEPTQHTRTNIEVLKRFLDLDVRLTGAGDDWTLEVDRSA